MCRIADFINGSFEPYLYDNIGDFYDTHRDILYGSVNNIQGISGSIGVYEWTAFQDDTGMWRTSVQNSNIEWIEVIQSSCKSLREIIEMIKGGWEPKNPFDGKHDLIICCMSPTETQPSVYLSAPKLKIDNGKVYFTEDTHTIDKGTIRYHTDTHSCNCRYLSDNRRFLSNISNWKSYGDIPTKTVEEVLESAVQYLIRKLEKDRVLSRKERQTAKYALSKISDGTMWEMIAKNLECSEEKAQELAREYILRRQAQLDVDDATKMMEYLITNDSSYVQDLGLKIEESWKAEHTSHINEVEAMIEAKNQELNVVSSRLSKASKELQACETKFLQIQELVNETSQLKASIEKEIALRLQEIQNDKAKALVDAAWTSNPPVFQQLEQPAPLAPKGYTLITPVMPEQVVESELEDRIIDAYDAWTSLCGDPERAWELTIFFYATYAMKQHLIIAGEGADLIADLCSYLIRGIKATKVSLLENTDLDRLFNDLESNPREYICVLNGLGSGYCHIQALLNRFPSSRFILTTQHAESLSMEPASLFTTFFPVLAEEFCMNVQIEFPDCFSCIHPLLDSDVSIPTIKQLMPIHAKQKKWFENDFYSPLLQVRCAKLHYSIKALCQKCSDFINAESILERTTYAMLMIPLMKCLRKKDVIRELLGETESLFEEERKQRIIQFVGIDAE